MLSRIIMNFRKTYLLIAILAGMATLTISPSFAQQYQSGMEVSLSAEQGSTSVTVSGFTSILSEAVAITVTSPNGNIVTIEQVNPDRNGNFMKVLKTNSLLWKQDGMYLVTTQQGERNLYKFRLPVQVIGGITQYTSVSDSSLDTRVTSGVTLPKTRFLTLDVIAPLGATTIDVRGQTDRTADVTIKVTAPNGNIVSIDQITPNLDGSFMTVLHTDSNLWRQDGFYTISAQQGTGSGYADTAKVEIVDGAVIPEFGAIAALVLAIAIVSIIAISAKTRLNVIPKY
jgi:predicted secreted protein with PEFG-CTERM motif